MSNEELAKLVRDGNADAMLPLWEQVKHFVFQQLRRYLGICEKEDLEQSGFIAVIRAAQQFDPEREYSFLTLLDFYLKQEFLRANGFRTNSAGKVHDPILNAISLDTPLSNEKDSDTIADLEPDPSNPFEETERRIYIDQLRQQLNKAIDQLPEDQKQIIRLRYFSGLTLGQTSEATQTAKYEIRKAELKALNRLRNDKELEQFIDDRTPFYGFVSVNQFMSTHESIVEKCVFKRERIEKK